MGEELRRFKVNGMIKFCVDDIFEGSLEDAKKRLEDFNILLDDLEAARCDGKLELITSEIEDMGLCDIDEFYAQRKKAPETDLQAASS